MEYRESIDRLGSLTIGEDKVVRPVPQAYLEFFREFFRSRPAEEYGIIASELVSPGQMDGAGAAIESVKIPFPTYPCEWSFQMLKSAVIRLLDVEIELAGHGYGLHDAHVWNVMFDNCNPLFIDLGSIISNREFKIARFRREFLIHSYTLLPVYKMGKDTYYKYALKLPDRYNSRFTSRWLELFARILLGNKVSRLKNLSQIDTAITLRDIVRNINAPRKNTKWENYYQDTPFSYTEHDNFTAKPRSVLNILEKLRQDKSCRTVLDIATNKGFFANLAESMGFRVGATDNDDNCIDELYMEGRERDARMTPFLMDILHPTPAHGLNGSYPPAAERLKADISIWMAIVHHLVFSGGADFVAVSSAVDAFTGKYAIVEFIPPDDQHVSCWMKPKYSWYNLDNFMKHMKRYFPKHEIFPSSPEPRITVFFER